MTGQLAGIRVLTLEQYIAGPYCTSVLADAGAEVIKVEQPGSGDPRRRYHPQLDPLRPEINAGYVPYNRGKKSIELDLHAPAGAEDLERLLATADVLVCNLRPGFLDKVGLSPERLRRDHPRLIVCEITGFGSTGGPRSAWPAFDSVIQASSGLSSLLGDDPEGAPQLAPMSTMDMLAGIYASLGILIALQGRERTGQGTHIDTSMHDVGAAFLLRPLTLYEFTGVSPIRGLDEHSPVGMFQAGDGEWVSIVIPTDEMWVRTCAALARPDLVDDEGLRSNAQRAAAMTSRILPALRDWAAATSAADAAARLRAAGQPAGVVATIADVRADADLAARGLFVGIEGFEDRVRVPRLPLLFDGEGAVDGGIARLGEHTAEVLGRSADREERTEAP